MGQERGFWERGAYRVETGPGYFRVYSESGRLLVSGTADCGKEFSEALREVEALEDPVIQLEEVA